MQDSENNCWSKKGGVRSPSLSIFSFSLTKQRTFLGAAGWAKAKLDYRRLWRHSKAPRQGSCRHIVWIFYNAWSDWLARPIAYYRAMWLDDGGEPTGFFACCDSAVIRAKYGLERMNRSFLLVELVTVKQFVKPRIFSWVDCTEFQSELWRPRNPRTSRLALYVPNKPGKAWKFMRLVAMYQSRNRTASCHRLRSSHWTYPQLRNEEDTIVLVSPFHFILCIYTVAVVEVYSYGRLVRMKYLGFAKRSLSLAAASQVPPRSRSPNGILRDPVVAREIEPCKQPLEFPSWQVCHISQGNFVFCGSTVFHSHRWSSRRLDITRQNAYWLRVNVTFQTSVLVSCRTFRICWNRANLSCLESKNTLVLSQGDSEAER